ncbi:MAG: AAA family ATPase, partial [Actinomycetes bacterium]
ALSQPRQVYTWSLTTGFCRGREPRVPDSEKPGVALAAAKKVNEPAVMVFADLHVMLGAPTRPIDPGTVRRLREVATGFRRGDVPRTMIIIAPQLQVPADLQKDITVVEFRLPRNDELSDLLGSMIKENSDSGRLHVELDDIGLERMAKAANGLTLAEAENAFAKAIAERGTLDEQAIGVVLEEKRQAVHKSGMMEVPPVDVRLEDVGGLDNMKRWLAKRDGSWLDSAAAYGLPAPKGVLIVGVPGCGKSLTAKAVAAAWGLPLLSLDIGRIYQGIVGSSEANMRTAIRIAEATAPCVLWIDEVEKGFAGVGSISDSGTSTRVFGSFLSWMQEKTAPVFVIATANDIEHLPPEFLRKGRFDEIFFVDLPTVAERKAIWRVQFRRKLEGTPAGAGLELSDDLIGRLADASEGLSGAEIENAVVVALFEAFGARRAVTEDDLMVALKRTVPLSVTNAEQIAAIRRWADTRAVAATASEHLPPRTASGVDGAADGESSAPAGQSDYRGGRRVDF